jgi:5'-nucleotidase
MQLHDGPIDLLVAGINNGANVGINVYYSGTIGAAMEGAFLGIPSVAMSLAVEAPGVSGDFEKAAAHCLDTLKKLMPIRNGCVININIPRLSKGPPKGVRVVPQSATGFNESYVEKTDENGHIVFQLIGDHHVVDGSPTDTTSLEDGYITITALAPDMTDHKRTRDLEKIDF